MFPKIKAALDAHQRLVDATEAVAGILHNLYEEGGSDPGLEARVAELERTVEKRTAEVEAMLLRAEETFKNARRAEERARGMERRAQEARAALAGDEEGDEDGEGGPWDEWLDRIQESHAEGGPAQGMLPLRGDVEGPSRTVMSREDEKDAQRARKFGYNGGA